MTQYLVAVHHPVDFDSAKEPQSTKDAISALNREMVASGIRLFAGGLRSHNEATWFRATPEDTVLVSDGPYAEAKEHLGGFWILECASDEEAQEWGRKAAVACRVLVEVRPFA